MVLFQERQHRFGRPADGGALARRPRSAAAAGSGWAAIALAMSALAEIGFLLLERLELGLAVADQLPPASPPTMSISFSTSALLGGCLRYSRIVGVDALLLQELERLPRFAAARVVPDRDGHARTMAARSSATSSSASGSGRVDHLFGNVVGEAGAGHRREVAAAVVLAVLAAGTARAAGGAPAPTAACHSRWPGSVSSSTSRAAIAWSSVSPSTPAMLELLAREPGRRAAPVQGARLGLGEGLVVDHAGVDELRDDGVDRLLDVVHHRRLEPSRPCARGGSARGAGLRPCWDSARDRTSAAFCRYLAVIGRAVRFTGDPLRPVAEAARRICELAEQRPLVDFGLPAHRQPRPL